MPQEDTPKTRLRRLLVAEIGGEVPIMAAAVEERKPGRSPGRLSMPSGGIS